MSDTVWIVAQNRSFDEQGWASDWDLGGVFSSEEKARAACMEPTDSMWAVTLDEVLPRERIEPPGLTFPLGETE
jgi:hypothetical protein